MGGRGDGGVWAATPQYEKWEARSGIASELLYVYDLVLMVMVGSSDGYIIVNSGK